MQIRDGQTEGLYWLKMEWPIEKTCISFWKSLSISCCPIFNLFLLNISVPESNLEAQFLYLLFLFCPNFLLNYQQGFAMTTTTCTKVIWPQLWKCAWGDCLCGRAICGPSPTSRLMCCICSSLHPYDVNHLAAETESKVKKLNDLRETLAYPKSSLHQDPPA